MCKNSSQDEGENDRFPLTKNQRIILGFNQDYTAVILTRTYYNKSLKQYLVLKIK